MLTPSSSMNGHDFWRHLVLKCFSQEEIEYLKKQDRFQNFLANIESENRFEMVTAYGQRLLDERDGFFRPSNSSAQPSHSRPENLV